MVNTKTTTLKDRRTKAQLLEALAHSYDELDETHARYMFWKKKASWRFLLNEVFIGLVWASIIAGTFIFVTSIFAAVCP